MDIKNTVVPYVVEQTGKGERSYDIYSRLLEDRIIFLTGEINDAVADAVVAQLIYLEGKERRQGLRQLDVFGEHGLKDLARGTSSCKHHSIKNFPEPVSES